MRLPDDVVYLPDETQLQEYIMNEEGIIYMGTWEYIKSIHWNYGQVTHKHVKCDWAEYICVCQPSGGWCGLSQQCGRDSQALAGSQNLSVVWRKHLDAMCQNVTRPHKQRLTHSQVAARAERMTNRQTVGVTDAHVQWGK